MAGQDANIPLFGFPEFGQRASALDKYPGSSPASFLRLMPLRLESVAE
jgi:hypothetical protein